MTQMSDEDVAKIYELTERKKELLSKEKGYLESASDFVGNQIGGLNRSLAGLPGSTIDALTHLASLDPTLSQKKKEIIRSNYGEKSKELYDKATGNKYKPGTPGERVAETVRDVAVSPMKILPKLGASVAAGIGRAWQEKDPTAFWGPMALGIAGGAAPTAIKNAGKNIAHRTRLAMASAPEMSKKLKESISKIAGGDTFNKTTHAVAGEPLKQQATEINRAIADTASGNQQFNLFKQRNERKAYLGAQKEAQASIFTPAEIDEFNRINHKDVGKEVFGAVTEKAKELAAEHSIWFDTIKKDIQEITAGHTNTNTMRDVSKPVSRFYDTIKDIDNYQVLKSALKTEEGKFFKNLLNLPANEDAETVRLIMKQVVSGKTPAKASIGTLKSLEDSLHVKAKDMQITAPGAAGTVKNLVNEVKEPLDDLLALKLGALENKQAIHEAYSKHKSTVNPYLNESRAPGKHQPEAAGLASYDTKIAEGEHKLNALFDALGDKSDSWIKARISHLGGDQGFFSSPQFFKKYQGLSATEREVFKKNANPRIRSVLETYETNPKILEQAAKAPDKYSFGKREERIAAPTKSAEEISRETMANRLKGGNKHTELETGATTHGQGVPEAGIIADLGMKNGKFDIETLVESLTKVSPEVRTDILSNMQPALRMRLEHGIEKLEHLKSVQAKPRLANILTKYAPKAMPFIENKFLLQPKRIESVKKAIRMEANGGHQREKLLTSPLISNIARATHIPQSEKEADMKRLAELQEKKAELNRKHHAEGGSIRRQHHMDGDKTHYTQEKPKSCSVATSRTIARNFGLDPYATEQEALDKINSDAANKYGGRKFSVEHTGGGMSPVNALHSFGIGSYHNPDGIKHSDVSKMNQKGHHPYIIAEQRQNGGPSGNFHVLAARARSPMNDIVSMGQDAIEIMDPMNPTAKKMPFRRIKDGPWQVGRYWYEKEPELYGARYPRKERTQRANSFDSLDSNEAGLI